MTLHLQHGPIDLICRAWGAPDEVARAYAQAETAFAPVLPTLCAELPLLRAGLRPETAARGPVARAMVAACRPFASGFVTPMAAVAGAVADHVLAAMAADRTLDRAFVNNRGDVAVHLRPGQALRLGVVTDVAAPSLDARVSLAAHRPARGVATSGRACKGQGGRSFSFGIADGVTVLARTAAEADAAATIIANAVDLPGHPAIVRRPADAIDPDSDLGDRPITWAVGALAPGEIDAALDAGRALADALRRRGLIEGAALALRGRFAFTAPELACAA